MDEYFHPTLYFTCGFLSMLGSNLIHISKRAIFKHVNIQKFWLLKNKNLEYVFIDSTEFIQNVPQTFTYLTGFIKNVQQISPKHLHSQMLELL